MNLARIARHELRQAWRTRALPALAAVVALLLLGAAVIESARHSADVAQRTRYEALVRQQWRDQPDRHPHRVSHYGLLVFRPRAPLGVFDVGVESFTGSTTFLEAHRQNSANFSEAAQADGTRQFGQLSMAMVLQLLLPLVIFAVAGTSITREREAGTLWLLLCQGASWRRIAWGKVLGIVLVALAVVAPGAMLAVVWLAGSARIELSLDAATRALALTAAHVAYVVVCAIAALGISAAHRTTRGALLTLISLWITLWIVLPRALPAFANSIYAIPSRATFQASVERRVRELGDSHNPNDPKFQKLKAAYLANFAVSRVEDLPINYNGIVMLEGEKLTTEAYRAHLAELTAVYRRQARLVEWFALVSPFVAMRTVSMALAGVDVPHSLEFERQVEDYRYQMIQRLNQLHVDEVVYARDRYAGGAEAGAPTRQRIDQAHFQDIEPFQFQQPSFLWAVNHQRIAITALFLWTILSVVGIVLLARRPLQV